MIKKLFKYLWLITKIILTVIVLIVALAAFAYYSDFEAHDGYVKTASGEPVVNVEVRIYCGVHDLVGVATEEFAVTDREGYYVFSLPSQECKSGYNQRTIAKGQDYHTVATKEVSFYQRDIIVKAFDASDYSRVEKVKKEKAKVFAKENQRVENENKKFEKEVEKHIRTTIDSNSWYTIKYADLNEDRLNEAFIHMVGTNYCRKSGSCSMEVVAQEDGKLVRVGWYDDVIKNRDFYIDTSYYSSSKKYKTISTGSAPREHIKMRFEGKLTVSPNKKSPSKVREELSLRVQRFVENRVATEIYLNRGYTLTFLGEEPNVTIVVKITHPTHDGRTFALKESRKDGLEHVATHLNSSTNIIYIVKDINSSFGFSKVVVPVYFKDDKKSVSRYETYHRDSLNQRDEYYPNSSEFDKIEQELKNIDNLIVL